MTSSDKMRDSKSLYSGAAGLQIRPNGDGLKIAHSYKKVASAERLPF